MATSIEQNFVRSRLIETAALIDTSVAAGAINSGDMVYNTGSGVASLSTPGASNANAANFVGVSIDTYPIPVAKGITETETTPSITIATEGDFVFKATNAQTFAPFAAVYLGADGQTVSTTATGHALGTVSPDQRPAGSTLGGSIAGTGTNFVVVHIAPVIV